MARRSSTVNFERIAHIQDDITLVTGDLLDEGSMIAVVSEHRPTEVYNLAAQSFVMTSFSQPVLTGDVTALGVTRMLEAIRIVDPDIRFYQASSSEMFGKVAGDAADRAHAVLSRARRTARRRRYGALDDGELPRELRPLRRVRGSCSTTVRRGAGSSSSSARSVTASRGSSAASPTSSRSATSTRGATGASPATTWRRCG